MAKLYPQPPHLIISVYPGQPEEHCFASLCAVAEQFGCTPSRTVELAPWHADFELRSDLAGMSSVLDVNEDRLADIVAGSDAGRPVRVGYRHKKNGVLVVEYLAAPKGNRHPIGISLSAESLGLPVDLWGKSERSSAARLAKWSKSLLLEATGQCAALYGAIGVEYSLAVPSELEKSVGFLPSEVFVSQSVLESRPALGAAIMDDFADGAISTWLTGVFCSGWAPFNDQGVTLPRGRTNPRRSGSMLGRIVSDLDKKSR